MNVSKNCHSVKRGSIRSYSVPYFSFIFRHLDWMRIPYSVQMRKNADPNNSKLGHFLRSVNVLKKIFFMDYCVINKSVETHTHNVFPVWLGILFFSTMIGSQWLYRYQRWSGFGIISGCYIFIKSMSFFKFDLYICSVIK